MTSSRNSRGYRLQLRTYKRIAWIFLFISFLPDIAMLFTDFMPGATIASVGVLMLTHVVAGLIAIYALPAMTKAK